MDSALIVTDVHPAIFLDAGEKQAIIEQLIRDICAVDQDVNPLRQPPIWLKSFSRVIFSFHTHLLAARAKQLLDYAIWHSTPIRAFYYSVSDDDASSSLLPPECDKQFLISPPCSPPLGWQQTMDPKPVSNAMPHSEMITEALMQLPPSMHSAFVSDADRSGKHILLLLPSPSESINVHDNRISHRQQLYTSNGGIPSIVLSDWDDDKSFNEQVYRPMSKIIPKTQMPH